MRAGLVDRLVGEGPVVRKSELQIPEGGLIGVGEIVEFKLFIDKALGSANLVSKFF